MKTGAQEVDPKLHRLSRRLISWRKRVQNEALREAGNLSSEERLCLAVLLEKACTHHRRFSFCFFAVMIGSMIFVPDNLFRANYLLVILSVSVIGFIAVLARAAEIIATLRMLMEQSADPALIPLALDMISNNVHGAGNQPLRDALKTLLPRLALGQAKSWTRDQRQVLIEVLNRPLKDPDLTVCILKMLEQVGDNETLKTVKMLAHMNTNLKYQASIRPLVAFPWLRRKEKEIQAAAMECLPFLEARVEEQAQERTLLRASQPNTLQRGETLLRPAEATVSTVPQEELLRPTTGG